MGADETVRRGDKVDRFGGEELAVLLSQIASVAEARAVAERIRARVGALTVDLGAEQPLTGLSFSIGVALYPNVDENSLEGRPGVLPSRRPCAMTPDSGAGGVGHILATGHILVSRDQVGSV